MLRKITEAKTSSRLGTDRMDKNKPGSFIRFGYFKYNLCFLDLLAAAF